MYCPLIAPNHQGKPDTCMTPLVQNKAEADRGVYWCPTCHRYADGSGGFPAGHPLRVRLEDRQAWRQELRQGIETQRLSQTALGAQELSEGSFQESA